MDNKRRLELDDALDNAWNKHDAKMDQYDFENSKSFQEMQDWAAPERESIILAGHAVALEKPIEWEDIPKYGHIFTKEEWFDNVKNGGFIDYDGSGNYASADKMSNISVLPSHLKRGWIRTDKKFTHIIWFNK